MPTGVTDIQILCMDCLGLSHLLVGRCAICFRSSLVLSDYRFDCGASFLRSFRWHLRENVHSPKNTRRRAAKGHSMGSSSVEKPGGQTEHSPQLPRPTPRVVTPSTRKSCDRKVRMFAGSNHSLLPRQPQPGAPAPSYFPLVLTGKTIWTKTRKYIMTHLMVY
jgi:hypothetical protein